MTLAYDSAFPKLKRINADGSSDANFTPGYSSEGDAFDVLVQNADGKIVVFSLTHAYGQTNSYRLIRYLP